MKAKHHRTKKMSLSPTKVTGDRAVKQIDLEQALKLRLVHGHSYQDIADYFGVTKQAVQQRLKRLSLLLENPALTTAYTDHRAQMLDAAELELLASLIDQSKLEKATVNQLAYAFRQVADMGRLERGMSTQNISVLANIVAESNKNLFRKETKGKEDILEPKLVNNPSLVHKNHPTKGGK